MSPVNNSSAIRNFYPRPPRGGRQRLPGHNLVSLIFLPTPSARRATTVPHLPVADGLFLPTPSARRATGHICYVEIDGNAISTHALREEGDDLDRRVAALEAEISTHALREEGDCPQCGRSERIGYFYPRPPRGGRPLPRMYPTDSILFLPTPSARRATYNRDPYDLSADISTHALREEGDPPVRLSGILWRISTHALREEGDLSAIVRQYPTIPYFYPRPPRGGRLLFRPLKSINKAISTHALREEGDMTRNTSLRSRPPDFYPRPPRGGRRNLLRPQQPKLPISTHALREEGDLSDQIGIISYPGFLPTPSARRATCRKTLKLVCLVFLPTPSARRATPAEGLSGKFVPISTHALREEGDGSGADQHLDYGNFYPRPPRGGRRVGADDRQHPARFLPTPSARRATPSPGYRPGIRADFYPRPPRGGRPLLNPWSGSSHINFYPRPPRGGRPKVPCQPLPPHPFLPTPSARRATPAT